MKRPLVIVALLYVGGVLLADFVSLPGLALLAISAAFLLAAMRWSRFRQPLLCALLPLIGATNLMLRTAILSPHDLRAIIGERAELVTLRGTLAETPYHRVYERDEGMTWRTMARVNVAQLRFQHQAAWQPAFGCVAVTTPGILATRFFAGQTVEVAGILLPPKPAIADGLFDYRAYLRRQGIYHQLTVTSPNDWRLLNDQASTLPLADRFNDWARKILALGLPVEDEPLRLLWAMTLGWKTALTGEVAEPFMRSGTMHIFAISGLHIALIAGILVSVLRVAQVPRPACGVLVIPLIWSYTGVTGWQASAIRSTVMMTIIIAGWSLKRPSDLLNSLAAAAFIILLWEPQQLFQASFQLSFFVVLSLALFGPLLEKIRRRWLQPAPLLPVGLRPRWRRWLDVPIGWSTASLVTSLAAWLGSIPLVAYYFHLFTPVSLLANVIVVPLSSLALAANLASLAVGGWFPACAELFNHSAWFLMWLMVRVSEWAAHTPGGCFYIGTPSPISFLAYYALLVVSLAGWLKRPVVRAWAATGLGIIGVAWLIHWQHERGTTRLTILPVAGGSAIYFDAAGSQEDFLIDAGDESAAEFILKPFLRAQGVNRLDRLLLSHGDLRHTGGAEFLSRTFGVKQILTSPVRSRSPAYRKLALALEKTPDRWRPVQRGDQIGPWRVLHPDSTDRFSQGDDNAVVLLSDFGDLRVLLLSDLGRQGQNALIERTPDLRADVVVAGLPAQAEPLSDALLDAIQPRVIVITDAEFPATERASPKLRERLAQRNVPVIYARTAGAVKLTFRGNGWQLQAMAGSRLSGGTD